METFIVYIDDKQYALQQVIPMLPANGQIPQAANWVLIGCPPRLNRHTGRWLTHAAQKNGAKNGLRKRPLSCHNCFKVVVTQSTFVWPTALCLS